MTEKMTGLLAHVTAKPRDAADAAPAPARPRGGVNAGRPFPDAAVPPRTVRCDGAGLRSGIDAVAAIADLLRAAAPRLLLGAGPAAAERFGALAASRLARAVDGALAALAEVIGRACASLPASERRALQDAVLAARPDREAAIADAARAIGTAGLLALLHDGVAARAPTSADALRCRALVFGGDHASAREAALDLATDRPDGRADARVRRAVSAHLGAAIATAHLSDEAAHRLRAALASDEPTAPAASTGGRGSEGQFARALAAGDADAAATVLAHAAGCSPLAIRRAMHGRDAEALVSFVWRADFSPDLATPAQIVLGRIPPALALAGATDRGFPLPADAMAWRCRALDA